MRFCTALAVLGLALTAACSSNPADEEPLRDLLSGSANEVEPSLEFRRLLEAGAPALIVAVEDRKATGLFALETRRRGIATWLSSDGLTLSTRSGFVVATRGFGGDLLASDATQSEALILTGRAGVAKRFYTFLNGNDEAVTRSFACDISSRGARRVDLGKREPVTRLMQERCQGLDQSFQNLYWVDLSRREIAQSRQWVGEFSHALALRLVLR